MGGGSGSATTPVVTYTAPWPVYALAWSAHTAPSAGSSSSPSSSSNTGLRRGPSTASTHSAHSPSHHQHEGSIPHGSRLAIGSLMEEYSNSMQVLGYLGERDAAGQPRLSLLANVSHPYPATKIAFQPSSLATSSSSSSNYMSPASKSANRASWGASHPSASPDLPLYPNDSAHDGFPDRELLATTADCLRIWECSRNADGGTAGPPWEEGGDSSAAWGDEEASIGAQQNGFIGRGGRDLPHGKTRFHLREKSVLAHSKSSMSPPAPLTSFSWCNPSPNLIVTSSVDTTCTVWDLPTRTALTQLIAHDREVYDVDWCPGSSDVFASVGADGSVRVFDLRSLEHSTIIYETAGPPPPASSRPGTGMSSRSSRDGSTAGGGNQGLAAPLLRIAFNPWDANYLATFHLESDSIQILDVRAPGLPILELKGHKAGINAVAWGPPSLAGMNDQLSAPLTPGTPSGIMSGRERSASASGNSSSSSSSISKGMICTAADDSQVLVYDLASSTLRSASAQGRRSRNSAAAAAAAAAAAQQQSPGPHSLTHSLSQTSLASSSAWGTGIPTESPFLAYDSTEMVNNVAWFRPGSNGSSGGGGATHGRSASTSIVAEWNDYTAHAKSGQTKPREDWLACAAGKELRCLRV